MPLSGPSFILALERVSEEMPAVSTISSKTYTGDQFDDLFMKERIVRDLAAMWAITSPYESDENEGNRSYNDCLIELGDTTRNLGAFPTYDSVRDYVACLIHDWETLGDAAGHSRSRYFRSHPTDLYVWFRDEIGNSHVFHAVLEYSWAAGANSVRVYEWAPTTRANLTNPWTLATILNPYEPEPEYEPEDDDDEYDRDEEEGSGALDLSVPAFGIELEVLCDKYDLSRYLREERVEVDDRMNYTHRRMSCWKMVPDSSLPSNGVELVSPVLYPGSTGPEQIARVTTALKKAGAHVDTACGFHIHHNAGWMSGRDLAQVTIAYYHAQPIIDTLLPYSRRNNSMCAHLPRSYVNDVRNLLDPDAYGYKPDPRHSEVAYHMPDRYHTVNLESLERHGTIEFRQHAGTTNKQKVTEWHAFTTALVEKAIEGANFDFGLAEGSYGNSGSVSDLCDTLALSDASRSYWLGRYDKFQTVSAVEGD